MKQVPGVVRLFTVATCMTLVVSNLSAPTSSASTQHRVAHTRSVRDTETHKHPGRSAVVFVSDRDSVIDPVTQTETVFDDVYALDPRTGHTDRLTSDVDLEWHPTVSRDGYSLAFIHIPTADGNAFLNRADEPAPATRPRFGGLAHLRDSATIDLFSSEGVICERQSVSR